MSIEDYSEFKDMVETSGFGSDDDGQKALLLMVVALHLDAYRKQREGKDVESARALELAIAAITKLVGEM